MLGYDLFESNTIGDDSTYVVSNTVYIAQSFTPSTAHNLFTLAVYAINAASCGTVTIRIYNTDSNGKPTGSALATMNPAVTSSLSWIYAVCSALQVDNTQLIFVVSAAATGLGVRYQSVGTYSTGKAWYSNNSGSTWTEITGASFLFQEWGQALPLHGTYRVTLYPSGEGTYTQLVGALNATDKPNYAYVNDPIDAVDDNPLNSVCYELTDVFKNSTDDDVFLSGLSDGAAGRLTGTTLLWKNGVAGIWGEDTIFTSELAEGYIVRSPSKSEWYTGTSLRLSEVLSIESDAAATLAAVPGDVALPGATAEADAFHKLWFYYPNNTATATAGLCKSNAACNMGWRGYMQMAYMPGIWTWTTGSDVVTAAGGSALSIYPDPDWVYQYIGTGYAYYSSGNPKEPRSSTAYPVLHVDSDNQVTLWNNYDEGSLPGITRVGWDGKTTYAYRGFKDDLSDDSTATQWADHEKFDTYAIKTTLNEGNIHRMYARFRVCVKWNETLPVESYFPYDLTYYTDLLREYTTIGYLTTPGYFAILKAWYLTTITSVRDELTTLTATYPTLDTTYAIACADATSALVTAASVGSVAIKESFDALFAAVETMSYSYVTVAELGPSGTAKPLVYLNGVFTYGAEQTVQAEIGATEPKVYQFEVVMSKPGGGVFTKDDLPDLEVGIILGNISDINKHVAVCCTQLCLIAEVSNLPAYLLTKQTIGIDDVGFIAFNDKWDEFMQFVGEDGVNTMGWKVHSIISSLWIFRPLRLISQGLRKIFRPSAILRLRRR